MNWRELTIAVVGGDRREQEIARCAAATGAEVRAYGFPWPEAGIDGVQHANSAAEAVAAAQRAISPSRRSPPTTAMVSSRQFIGARAGVDTPIARSLFQLAEAAVGTRYRDGGRYYREDFGHGLLPFMELAASGGADGCRP